MTGPWTMTERGPEHGPGAGSLKGVVLFVVALTALRLAYLAFFCPYTLIEDEAHYWEWSRHLGLSYYTKGPGIAWVIAASRALAGDTELGVRLFTPIFSGIASLSLAGLALDITRSRRVALFSALCFQLIPAYQFTSLIMTIDMPYVACWSAAAWAAWRALEGGRRGAWVALGLVLGIGVLFKYTMLLLVPGLVAYAWWRGRARAGGAARFDQQRAVRASTVPYILLGLIAFVVAVSPILIWNQREGWPTIRHLLGHLGVSGGDMPVTQGTARQGWRYNPAWTLEFFGAQAGLVGPMLGLMVMGVVRFLKRPAEVEARRGAWFLLLCAAPIILFYLLVSFVAEGEGNWAIAGYAPLTILAAMMVTAEAPVRPVPDGATKRRRSAPQKLWRFTLVFGLCAGVGMLRIDWARKLPVLGPKIPIGRLMGADARAREFQHLADDLAHRTGLPTFFAAPHYGRASQMAFYLPGHPIVYCTSRLMGGRATQYDYWPQTNLADPAVQVLLEGRPAVMSGGEAYQWERGFERVENLGQLPSESKRGRQTYSGFGYRGFGPATTPRPAEPPGQ